MKTSQLREVIKQNFDKQIVILEKGLTCELFWESLTDALYHDSNLETLRYDSIIRASFRAFAKVDSLELVNSKGKILKRFAKFYKESHGEKLSDQIAGIIGDKLQYYVVNENEHNAYYVDFTDDFNWNDGQFGKSGSCYFGTYSDSIPALQDNGAFCIRFYSSLEDTEGIGRTWIYPKDGLMMCFNSYGVERPKVSKVIKTIFAKSGIELHYKAVEIHNSYNSEIPFINSGTGFILYPENITEFESKYDVAIEWDSDDGKTICEGCGTRFDMDSEGAVVGDYCYCDSCVNNLFSMCDKCNEYCTRDEVHEITGSSRYSYICSYCADTIGAALCDDCGDYCVDYTVADDTRKVYCEHCEENNLYYCESCNENNTEEHHHEEESEEVKDEN